MKLSSKLHQAILALSLALLVAFGSIFKLPQLALRYAGLSISAVFVAAFSDRVTAASLKVFPSDFMTNVKTNYGAVGDGVTDDTAAIQRALNDGRSRSDDNGLPKAIYFPAGTYLVNNTLTWSGCCLSLQGQGSGNSIIKLQDKAAGYGDSKSPKAVFQTPDGNTSFRQNISDLTVNTGSQ